MTLITRLGSAAFAAVLILALTGCLYPEEQRAGSDASAREAVLTVQDAVDRYQQATGLLPIQNADASVPLYEKYKLDLGKMKRMDYLGSIPSVAFENGGSSVFLVIDEETKPLVKLMDVAVFQAVDGVQDRVTEYRTKHGGAIPSDAEAYPGFWTIDYGKLGGSEPDVRSMFSRQILGLIVDKQGRVYADYGIDIATAIKKTNAPPTADEDLRRRLVDASFYVPVKSPVYRWIDNAPQAVAAN